jgi:cell shape-determining protein MreC
VTTLTIWTTIINALLVLVVAAAGIFAFRRTYSRTISDIQDRVISVLREENSALTQQVNSLTQQVTRLQSTIATIQHVLREKGIVITVVDDYVTLRSTTASNTTTVRIRRDELEQRMREVDLGGDLGGSGSDTG